MKTLKERLEGKKRHAIWLEELCAKHPGDDNKWVRYGIVKHQVECAMEIKDIEGEIAVTSN